MTVWLQGERGGQVQSDVGEGALQGGHAVSGGQRPALHDAHVVGAVDALQICYRYCGRGGVFHGPAIFTSWRFILKVII